MELSPLSLSLSLSLQVAAAKGRLGGFKTFMAVRATRASAAAAAAAAKEAPKATRHPIIDLASSSEDDGDELSPVQLVSGDECALYFVIKIFICPAL